VKHHLDIGFQHIFLFYEDAPDRWLSELAEQPRVSLVARDASLERRWQVLPSFKNLRSFIAIEVMARQILNATVAIGEARELGIQWLLHLDSDELFQPSGGLHQHLSSAMGAGAEQVVYWNHEAVPEAIEVIDCFKEVTLFKANVNSVSKPTGCLPYIAYTSGKAAVRLDSTPVPHGVHRFSCPGAPAKTLVARRSFVLHYPCCGFSRMLKKYEMLGNFADKWFGQVSIEPNMSFHALARDCVSAGRHEDALALYRARVMLTAVDTDMRERLLESGHLLRVTGPADSLLVIDPAELADHAIAPLLIASLSTGRKPLGAEPSVAAIAPNRLG